MRNGKLISYRITKWNIRCKDMIDIGGNHAVRSFQKKSVVTDASMNTDYMLLEPEI